MYSDRERIKSHPFGRAVVRSEGVRGCSLATPSGCSAGDLAMRRASEVPDHDTGDDGSHLGLLGHGGSLQHGTRRNPPRRSEFLPERLRIIRPDDGPVRANDLGAVRVPHLAGLEQGVSPADLRAIVSV